MSFAVLAELPLGVYRGLTPDGGLDPLPAPARLHAALLCAAAQGPRAVPDGDLLAPCDADVAALRWLEEHPPDGVVLPTRHEVKVTTVAFRKEGTLVREGKDTGPKEKVFARQVVGLVAVDGEFGWTWGEPPPQPVIDALSALVADISHLGNSESPARLRLGEATPTHRRDPRADLFAGTGLDLDVAVPGRADALRQAYRSQQAARPSVSADGYATSERALPPLATAVGREPARYRAPQTPRLSVPWQVVHLAQLQAPPPTASERVAWAVAAHRALIARLVTAPPLLTGAYEPGAVLPANRAALQFLGGRAAEAVGLDPDRASLLLLLPTGAEPVEMAAIADVFTRLDRLILSRRPCTVRSLPPRAAATFWPEPGAGTTREWVTVPAMVPDTRAPRRGSWTLGDTALLSLGLVLRDQLAVPPGKGSAWYEQVRTAVAATGARVADARRITEGNLARYVHHAPPGVAVQPLRVGLVAGSLVGDRTLLAVGQSRHLGGGLLIPRELAGGAR